MVDSPRLPGHAAVPSWKLATISPGSCRPASSNRALLEATRSASAAVSVTGSRGEISGSVVATAGAAPGPAIRVARRVRRIRAVQVMAAR